MRDSYVPSPLTTIDLAQAKQLAAELRPSFTGDLVLSDDPGYEDVRAVWNAMVERRPTLIARCGDTKDIAAVVRLARPHGLLTSVRGGGHNVAGKALADGGLTIDLSPMRTVRVDPARRTVRAQGGSTLGDLDGATAEHGLAVPAGIVSHTGIAGLTLGGGGGWLAPKYGMTCDNLMAVELVTADGDVVEVSDENHPDLMWALRGGGGNFGVVTEFRYRAHEVAPALRIGLAVYRAEDATEALRHWAERYPGLPDELSTHAILKQALPPLPFVPAELHGQRGVLLVGLYIGDPTDTVADGLLGHALLVAEPAALIMDTMPFAQVLQRFVDEDFAAGSRYYTKEAQSTSFPAKP